MFRLLNLHVTKTCLYNIDPLKSHFYIVKLGFTWVYIIFLILLKNIDCEYSLDTPGNQSTCTPTVYYKEISKPVLVDLSMCVNNFPEC